jgi:hypothetical protein
MPENYWQEQDVQIMLNEFGLSVTVGAVTAKGTVDRTDEEMKMAGFTEFIGKAILVTLYTKTFAAVLAVGAAITVDGTAYKIHELLQSADGALTRVLCAKE